MKKFFKVVASFALFGLLAVSCDKDDPKTEDDTTGGDGTELVNPADVNVEFKSDGTQTLSWQHVSKATGYELTVYNANDTANLVVLNTKENQVVEGTTLTCPAPENTNFMVKIRTLSGDASAKTPFVKRYSNKLPSYATIPAGDLAQYFTANPIPQDSVNTVLVYELAANGEYSMTDSISLGAASITLRGVKGSSAKLNLTKGYFQTSGGSFGMEYVDIDAENRLVTDLQNEAIVMVDKVVSEVAQKTSTGYAIINSISFKSVNINKTAGPLLNGQVDAKGWAIGELLIDDCVIRVTGGSARFLRGNGFLSFRNLTMRNSTVWNDVDGNSQYFIQLQGEETAKIGVADWTGGTFTIDHCTFFRAGQGNQFANLNNLFNKTGNDKIYVTSTIFVDCGNKQIMRRLGNNQSRGDASLSCNYNTYWFAGAVVPDETDSELPDGAGGVKQNTNAMDRSGTSIKEDPMFANAANGDFTVGGAGQKAQKTGDPRWLK